MAIKHLIPGPRWSLSRDHDDDVNEWSDEHPFLEKHLPDQPFYRRHTKSIWIHTLLCMLNLIVCMTVWSLAYKKCTFGANGPNLVYTPARDAIAYESQTWDPTNIFLRNGSVNPHRLHKEFGPPSSESEEAWEKLLQHQSIRLRKDQLGEYHDRPGLVELSDGSGYYATLSAYHSLHCIKKLHHLMYFDHYYSAMTDDEVMLVRHHAEHCLNIMRQTVQCNADLSILPMQWGTTTSAPIGLDEGHHQCVQWDRIDRWMQERSIDVFSPGLLVHPTLGEAFPDGEGNKVGIALDKLISTHDDS